MSKHPAQGAASSGTLPAVTFNEDGSCLAAALRAACWSMRTLPDAAAVVTLSEPEPLWVLAAALTGVTLLVPGEPIADRRVVAVLADVAGWPERARIDDAEEAARRLGVPLLLDAPRALVDPDALGLLTALDDTLVAITSGDARWSPWTTRLTGTARLLRHARRSATAIDDHLESVPA